MTMSVWPATGDGHNDRDRLHAGRIYFWTIGGTDCRCQVVASAGLPDAQAFTGLLTGRFDARQDA